MEINKNYMNIIIHKLFEDIKAKEIDYGLNGVKVQILLGRDETQVLLDALDDTTINEAAEKAVKDIKQNYIPKDVLDKINTEIEQVENEIIIDDKDLDEGKRIAFMYTHQIIDKYRAESEAEE